MNQKSLYLVVTAAILMFLGAIIFFLIQDSSRGYTDTSEALGTQAECKKLKANFKAASSADDEAKAESIYTSADDKGCTWTESISAGGTPEDDELLEETYEDGDTESSGWTITPSGRPCEWLSGDSC